MGAGLLRLKEEYKGYCGGERELDKEVSCSAPDVRVSWWQIA